MSFVLGLIIVVHVILAVALGLRVALMRMSMRKGMGGADPVLGAGGLDGEAGVLARAIRVHGNFVEWVPLALITLFAAEARGAGPVWIGGLGALLFVSRLGHAQGLGRSGGVSFGRRYGVVGTVTVMLAASTLALTADLWR